MNSRNLPEVVSGHGAIAPVHAVLKAPTLLGEADEPVRAVSHCFVLPSDQFAAVALTSNSAMPISKTLIRLNASYTSVFDPALRRIFVVEPDMGPPALSVELLRPLPSMALAPIAMLVFGFGYRLELFVVAFTRFFPMLLLTQANLTQQNVSLVWPRPNFRSRDLGGSGCA